MLDTVEAVFEAEAATDSWRIQTARLVERLDAPYALELRLLTAAEAPDPAQLLGKAATVTITRGAGMRTVHGIVAELTERTAADDYTGTTIDVVLRPAFEALRHRVNTRIFQDATVPEILAEVLDAALGPYERSFDDRTQRSFPTCEYRVQYDESDLAFCERLMQEEGIVYWFEHDGDAETLVLADGPSAYGTIETAAGASPLPITHRDEGDLDDEWIRHLDAWSRITPTKVAMRHFDWTAPSTPIESEAAEAPSADLAAGAGVAPDREVYVVDHDPLTIGDYAGTAYGANDAVDQARLRREAHIADACWVDGRSNVIAMRPGATFECAGHAFARLDGEYLVVSVEHRFDDEANAYDNVVRCIPKDVVHRPQRRAARPVIRSVQTAIVVGPSGEEIHTDEHGRIKVQFHWDRLGAGDEHSSCWIRVMQPWAGAGWGFVFLPRIGMEVVV
ncbi:MAG: type VI secretion system tip protein VgrG, partial [Myxococcales bacterium]|nr:type VI secretion system tip protein VgrG [Myxococcales bacterium]